MDGKNDSRLIEAGFPCHQVGAETQRERDTGQAPPTHRLHVWWARRPLTPSRAAIVASLDPASTDPETFVRQLGIERVQALVKGEPWTLTGTLLEKIENLDGKEFLPVDQTIIRALEKEQGRRLDNRRMIRELKSKNSDLANDPVLRRWEEASQPLPTTGFSENDLFPVQRTMGDPAWFKELMEIAQANGIRVPNMYGYDRAYAAEVAPKRTGLTVLDPTAGGGSIPFEALRLGHNVIANELNPVATTILYGTLNFPALFGKDLLPEIEKWGKQLLGELDRQLPDVFKAEGPLMGIEELALREYLKHILEYFPIFNKESVTSYLYARQVICPNCLGEAPLLNTCWLSKQASDPWGVKVIPDGKQKNGKVRFETYRMSNGKGPQGEDPDFATVSRGTGLCIHCRQAIPGDEIKAQARGESEVGQWQDRLYAVVAVRLQPKLDKNGKPVVYKSGEKKGQIKTEKIRYFRPPNERDLEALAEAKKRLDGKWEDWEARGLIPTEHFPEGNDIRPVTYGMPRFCDMFTPRQLLGHLTLAEGLNKLKPQILAELGSERGRAIITYLQFAIDKGLDYNSRQTRWEFTRGIVKGTFGRHDFSLKWTFGEMIFTGPASGAAWGLSQVVDAYKGMSELVAPVHNTYKGALPLKITQKTAAYMPEINTGSVDLVCMDPPYYDNVQYSELSDYFYVWQKRTLKDIYPEINWPRLTNKREEAVANPIRDSGAKKAKQTYEKMMGEIFRECRRVIRDNGLMTLMFTHKSQDAWETLTRSLIEAGWTITASFPVESESGHSTHQMNMAAAASSIFISCRKREQDQPFPAVWTGLGGQGVAQKIQDGVQTALKEFKPLKLNPVDTMVACYGRALQILSEQWPVMDGDEEVSPIRAMIEASRVVAQNQIKELTHGRLGVEDLDPETGMALTVYGIYGHHPFAYDEALNLSRSLNISLLGKTGGYRVEESMIGINQEARGRGSRREATGSLGFHAPLVRNGSKLRLAWPGERHHKRLEDPQTDWDLLHGIVQAYRKGDVPVARAYLEKHAPEKSERLFDLLQVYAAEMDDKKRKQEAEILLFGLKNQS